MTSTEYAPRLDDWTTAALIDAQRKWPVESVAVELERRGVTLWHYALRRDRS
jgi:hypothetical protein